MDIKPQEKKVDPCGAVLEPSKEPSTHHAFVRLNVGQGQQRVGETQC